MSRPRTSWSKENLPELLSRIEEYRQRLYEGKNSDRLLIISQELDILINLYYRIQTEKTLNIGGIAWLKDDPLFVLRRKGGVRGVCPFAN